jgi:tyrosyl-tRNA synthetase
MNRLEKIEEILSRGVAEVIVKDDFKKLLLSKKKLRLKLGIDPTSSFIHIGRACVLWKLRALQDLGHTVVFIVGDFTGQIGDTSDKDSERPMLSEAQVKENLKTYFAQAFKILDKSKTETYYNSKWLKKLGFMEIGKLADAFGVNEFISRELIKKRLDGGKRVSVRELLYPLMQGYDSVAVKADTEFGGTDQRFNLLAGRTIQPLYGQKPQNIMTLELLEGLDGRKMSSSWGNVINILDEAKDMFGKVMSLRDDLVERYFVLATTTPLDEVKKILSKSDNPRDTKLVLAHVITSMYHGKQKADEAREAFISQFSKKELPDDIETKKMKKGFYDLVELLFELKMVSSKGEARRLIDQNGVKVNGKVVKADEVITIDGEVKHLISVGKRKFVYVQ